MEETQHLEERQRPQIVVDQEENEKMRQWYTNLNATKLYISDEYQKKKQENGFHDAEGVNDMFKMVSSVIQKIREEHTRQMKVFRECRAELLERRKNEEVALAKHKAEIDKDYQKYVSAVQQNNAQLREALYESHKTALIMNSNIKLDNAKAKAARAYTLAEYAFRCIECVPCFDQEITLESVDGVQVLVLKNGKDETNIDMNEPNMTIQKFMYEVAKLMKSVEGKKFDRHCGLLC
jgi:hypothetical protein